MAQAVRRVLRPGTGLTDCGGGGDAAKDFEMFTWWADGSEKAGLDALVSVLANTGTVNH